MCGAVGGTPFWKALLPVGPASVQSQGQCSLPAGTGQAWPLLDSLAPSPALCSRHHTSQFRLAQCPDAGPGLCDCQLRAHRHSDFYFFHALEKRNPFISASGPALHNQRQTSSPARFWIFLGMLQRSSEACVGNIGLSDASAFRGR